MSRQELTCEVCGGPTELERRRPGHGPTRLSEERREAVLVGGRDLEEEEEEEEEVREPAGAR